jgi:predicted NBD/HSP70 family sugar kinase
MEEINTQAGKIVGVELSASSLKAVCLDGTLNVVNSHKTLLNRENSVSTQVISFINELRELFGDFSKIGIAVPGLLDRQTNRVKYSTHIPEQVEIDFADEIRKQTGILYNAWQRRWRRNNF